MPKKAIIFDADGVLILRKEYFSQKYSRETGVPLETLNKFFNSEFGETLVGKKDLKELLSKVLVEWKWEKSVDELLEYWFSSEATIDNELIGLIELLRAKGIKTYLATNNEHHRTNYLAKTVGLEKYFDKIYSSALVGHKKTAKEFYNYILTDTGHTPDELLFFDDDPENVEGAKILGIKSYVYEGIEKLRQAIFI